MASARPSAPPEGASLAAQGRRLADEGCWEEALQRALQVLESDRGSGDAAAAARLALEAYGALGKRKEAAALGEKELGAFRSQGDRRSEVAVLIGLAASERESDKATKHAEEALRVARGCEDKQAQAEALLAVAAAALKVKGSGAERQKAAEQAKASATEAAALFEAIGDLRGSGEALRSLAAARCAGGSVEAAAKTAREAAAAFQKAGLRALEALELRAAASLLLEEGGEAAEAVAAAEEAIEVLEEAYVFARPCECAVVETLVRAHMQAKDFDKALKAARDGVDRFQDAGDKRGEGGALELIGRVQAQLGLHSKAARTAQKAAYAYEDAGDRRGQASALRSASRMMCRLGRHDKALRWLQEALTTFEELGDLAEQAATLQLRAEVYVGKGDSKSAARCAVEARELFQDAKDAKGEAQALLQLATAEVASEDFGRAARTAEEAQALASQTGDMETEASAHRALGDIYMKGEQYESALKAGQRALALYRELGDCRTEEVATLMHNSAAQTLLIMKKDQEGRATEKSFKDATDKALKSAKEALSVAKRLGGDHQGLVAAAQYTIAQCYTTTSKSPEALKAVEESIKLFKDLGDLRGEAAALVVLANVQFQLLQDFARAKDVAEEAVWLFQQAKDSAGEARAWELLDRVEAAEAELRQHQQLQQQQAQMSAAMAQQMSFQMMNAPPPSAQEAAPGSGMPAVPRPGYDPKLEKLDVKAGLAPAEIHKQIAEVAKGLIGIDEEIELDMPLMEAGLTSNTAVLLRDVLTQQLPGISLPVTLTFDYPSIGSMTELIMENAAKLKK